MAAIVGIDADILFVAEDTVSAVSSGGIATVTITTAGTGYAVGDTVSVNGADDDEDGILTISAETGGVPDSVTITTPGAGYTTSDTTVPTVVVSSATGADLVVTVASINPLCLPKWSTNDTEWTILVNNSAYSWALFPERNEFSISISVDIAEHKVFVEEWADAWVGKARLYMDWSGSMSGYLDTSSDAIFTSMKEGDDLWCIFINSKNNDAPTDDAIPAQYWLGKVILGSIDMSTPNEDYVTLDVDFAGNGKLYRSELPY